MTTTSPAHSWVQQCTVCGTVHDRDKLHDGLCYDCVANKLQAAMAELERVNAAAGEMRSALEDALTRCVTRSDRDAIRSILSTGAGKDYVRKADMKPLVEALEGAKVIALCYAESRCDTQALLDNNENVLRIDDALRIAKEKGFA